MASSRTSLPHKTGPGPKQGVYQPELEDFGFDSLDITETEINAAAPPGSEDFGCDHPQVQLKCEKSWMDGMEDFGFDMPEAVQFVGTGEAPQPDACWQGDKDFGMDGPLPPDVGTGEAPQPDARWQGDEDFGMDGPLPPDVQESFGGPPEVYSRS
jgi:hypothetical protein